jgi:hypothetical protein
MKIRILSDTHLESYTGEYDPEHHTVNPSLEKLIKKLNETITDVTKDEILVLPGDLGMVTNSDGTFNPDYEKLLHYFKSRWENVIVVPGNTEYKPGIKVKLNIPANQEEGELDNRSGSFLITSVRHVLYKDDKDMKYECVLECKSDSQSKE